MIETITGSLYSVVAMTALFGILLLLSKDLKKNYRYHSTIENVGLLFICLALIEVIVLLWVEVVIYYVR